MDLVILIGPVMLFMVLKFPHECFYIRHRIKESSPLRFKYGFCAFEEVSGELPKRETAHVHFPVLMPVLATWY